MANNCVYAHTIDCEASEFADDVYKRLPKNIYHDELTAAIDDSLQEVREVLDALRTSRDCWCVATWKGAHDGRCVRARALMSKLAIEAGE